MSSGKAEFKRKRKAGLKDLPQPQRRIAEQLVDLALEHAPDAWWAWVNAYNYCYCKRWAVK